jgi:hypothetical protein
MNRDLFDPTPEQQIIVLVGAARVKRAEKLIACERCNPEGAEIPFDAILDYVTGSDPSVTDYILEQPAICPYCRRDVLERTLVHPRYAVASRRPPQLVHCEAEAVSTQRQPSDPWVNMVLIARQTVTKMRPVEDVDFPSI